MPINFAHNLLRRAPRVAVGGEFANFIPAMRGPCRGAGPRPSTTSGSSTHQKMPVRRRVAWMLTIGQRRMSSNSGVTRVVFAWYSAARGNTFTISAKVVSRSWPCNSRATASRVWAPTSIRTRL
jgi:hypothetical protein